MRPAGFTLIELLIVISITSLLTVVGFVNFKNFSQDQVIIRATGQIQTLLRLAHSNASTSVKCSNTQPAVSWLLVFNTNRASLTLKCKSPISPIETDIKTITLENKIVIEEITTPSCVSVDFPGRDVTLVYSAPLGKIDFVIPTTGDTLECPNNTREITVTVKDNKTQITKNIIISKGGEVNVQ